MVETCCLNARESIIIRIRFRFQPIILNTGAQIRLPSMPSGCEKVKLGLLRKQLSLGSLTRKISRTSQGSAADAEEGCIREVRSDRNTTSKPVKMNFFRYLLKPEMKFELGSSLQSDCLNLSPIQATSNTLYRSYPNRKECINLPKLFTLL